MRARTLMLLFLAVVLAGGTAFLARSWVAAQRAKESGPEGSAVALQTPSRSVLVARADIRKGQILRPEEMVWQIWPEGALDKNYVVLGGAKTPESYAGWVARNPINGGEPITETKIIAPGSRGFLAAVLRPGMRAVSVSVSVTAGISGFIFPGDQVDLMLTYGVAPLATGSATQDKNEVGHKVAETVLRDIRVIAIDQRLESKPGEAVVAHTVTFEVTPKQTEIIAVAQELQGAKMSLVLRSLVPDPQDAGVVKTDANDRDPPAALRAAAGAERLSLASATGSSAIQTAAAITDGGAGTAPAVRKAGTLLAADDSKGAAAAKPLTPSGRPQVVSAPSIGTDVVTGRTATYTTDNEVSALLPALKGQGQNEESPDLFICKSSGSGLACSSQKDSASLLLIEAAKAARELDERSGAKPAASAAAPPRR